MRDAPAAGIHELSDRGLSRRENLSDRRVPTAPGQVVVTSTPLRGTRLGALLARVTVDHAAVEASGRALPPDALRFVRALRELVDLPQS